MLTWPGKSTGPESNQVVKRDADLDKLLNAMEVQHRTPLTLFRRAVDGLHRRRHWQLKFAASSMLPAPL